LAASVANQPTSIAIGANFQPFLNYESGIFNNPSCPHTTSSLDHAVLIVGYNTQGSQDYWIVKNSWGTSWGISGYVWMAKVSGNSAGVCGLALEPGYPYGQQPLPSPAAETA